MKTSQTNPFTEKSQNIFNGVVKAPRNNQVPNIQTSKPLISHRAHNNSIMYNTVTDPNRANKKPEKENSTHHFLPQFCKKNQYTSKNTSNISGAPNSARGAIEFLPSVAENYKTRIPVNQSNKSLTRNPSAKYHTRAGSIDKKIRNERRLFNNTNHNQKHLMKTQSMVVGNLGGIGINKFLSNTRQRYLGNQKEEFKKFHMKSIALDLKGFKDNFNDKLSDKHHQSVVVYSTNQNKSIGIDGTIGPQKNKIQIQVNQKQTRDEENSLSDLELIYTTDKKKDDALDESASTCSQPDLNKKKIQEIFAERMQNYRDATKKNLCENDLEEFQNPQNLSEFSQIIFENLKKEELEKMVPVDYLSQVQTEIKDTSRAFLIEWVIDVHRKFRLTAEALYVSVFIIDQFLSKKSIQKSQLHLLGVATLLIAAKYEEIYPPTLNDFLAVSENKFTKQMVLQMEIDILTAMEFKVTAPSAYRFLQRYRLLNKICNDDEVFFYAQYLQEIQLLDASLLRFRQSEIAAAALILSTRQLKKTNCWNSDMEKFSGYSDSHLQEVVKEVRSFCVEINPKFISTLKYKFSKPEYKEVAKHQFKF